MFYFPLLSYWATQPPNEASAGFDSQASVLSGSCIAAELPPYPIIYLLCNFHYIFSDERIGLLIFLVYEYIPRDFGCEIKRSKAIVRLLITTVPMNAKLLDPDLHCEFF